jgi:hypothetical protein
MLLSMEKKAQLPVKERNDDPPREMAPPQLFGLDGRRCYLTLLLFMLCWCPYRLFLDRMFPLTYEERALNILKSHPLIGKS